MSIGKIRHVDEMTTFLESKDVSVDITRKEELVYMGTPILTTGGGSNCKVPKEGLANIQHMLIVLKTELLSQKK